MWQGWMVVMVWLRQQVFRMAQPLSEEPEEGQSMVEYAIIAALVAVAALVVVQQLGSTIAAVFQNIMGHMQTLIR